MLENGTIGIEHADILVGPHQVAFDITNKCNLRCLHCYNASGENHLEEDELSDGEVLEFIEDISNMNLFNFCFCGGEPLLRKELIYRACEILRAKTPAIHLSMVTNGILLTEEIALKLKDVGVSRVQISLDGSNACSHDRLRNKPGSFDKAINALEILNRVGLESAIAFTPTAFNVDEIEELHQLAIKLGVSNELRTQPLMLLGRANSHLENIKPTDDQYRKMIRTINRINSEGKGPNIQWGDPIDHLIRFRTKTSHCINFSGIRANGDLTVSAYLPLVVGNTRKHKFSEYWDHGLSKIWTYEFPKKIAMNITSIEEMNKPLEALPVVWQDKDIVIDLIEDIELLKSPTSNQFDYFK